MKHIKTILLIIMLAIIINYTKLLNDAYKHIDIIFDSLAICVVSGGENETSI